MKIALKVVAFIVGLALLGATAHVTIAHTGGYGTPHSVLTLAIAGGIGIGALCIGAAWADGRAAVAAWLIVAILAGEGFGFLMTADRLIVGREAQQVPLRVAQEAYAKAEKRVQDAEDALATAPATSPRLTTALAAKSAADAAVVEKSAERGCLVNCRQLLQGQVDAAAGEVALARAEIDVARKGLVDELEVARTALTSMKPPVSTAPLADRLGWPAWVLDLLMAALGSMAANGLACGLTAFSAHHRREQQTAVANVMIEAAHIIRPTEHAARFAVEALQKGGQLEVRQLPEVYRAWCSRTEVDPLPEGQIVPALADLFKRAGLAIAKKKGRLVAIGISLPRASDSRAITWGGQ